MEISDKSQENKIPENINIPPSLEEQSTENENIMETTQKDYTLERPISEIIDQQYQPIPLEANAACLETNEMNPKSPPSLSDSTTTNRPDSAASGNSTKSTGKKKSVKKKKKKPRAKKKLEQDSSAINSSNVIASAELPPETTVAIAIADVENELKETSSKPSYDELLFTQHNCSRWYFTLLFFVIATILVVGYGVIDIVISGLYFTPERTSMIFNFSNATASSSNDFETATFSLFIPAFDFLWKYLMVLKIFPTLIPMKASVAIGILGVIVRVLARFIHVYPSIYLDTPANEFENAANFSNMFSLFLVGGELNLVLRTFIELWFLPLIFYYFAVRKSKQDSGNQQPLLQLGPDKFQGAIALAWNIMYYVSIGVLFYKFESTGVNEAAMAQTLFVILYVPLVLSLVKDFYDSLYHRKHAHSLSHLFLAVWVMMIILDYIGTSIFAFQSVTNDFARFIISLLFNMGFEILQVFFVHIVLAVGATHVKAAGFVYFIQFGNEFLDQMLILELKITDGLFIALVILQIVWRTVTGTGAFDIIMEKVWTKLKHVFGAKKHELSEKEKEQEEVSELYFQIMVSSQDMMAEAIATLAIPTFFYLFAYFNPELVPQNIYFYGMTSMEEYYSLSVLKRHSVILACRIIKNSMVFLFLHQKLTKTYKKLGHSGCSISCLIYSHFRKRGWGFLFLFLSIAYMNIMTGIRAGLGTSNPEVQDLLSELPQFENYSYPSYWDITLQRIVAT